MAQLWHETRVPQRSRLAILVAMTRWFTADLHLGHANIIDYSRRPFDSVDEMNRALIDNWNEVVDDDEVWMLGDFALGKIAESLPLVGGARRPKVSSDGKP
ncbi:MAG: hypothetical protein ACRD0A_14675 [Acidimicrobiales bacterium]